MPKFTMSLNISMNDSDVRSPAIAGLIKEVMSQLLNLELTCLEEGIPYHIHKITGSTSQQNEQPDTVMLDETDGEVSDEDVLDATEQYVQDVLKEVGRTTPSLDTHPLLQQLAPVARTIEQPESVVPANSPIPRSIRLSPSVEKMYNWISTNCGSEGVRPTVWIDAVGISSSNGYAAIRTLLKGNYIVKTRVRNPDGSFGNAYALPETIISPKPIVKPRYSNATVEAINWLRENCPESGISITNWSKESGISRSTINTVANICARDGLVTVSRDPNTTVGMLYKPIIADTVEPTTPQPEALSYADYAAADDGDDNIGNRIDDSQPDNIGNLVIDEQPEMVVPDVNGNTLEDDNNQIPDVQNEESNGRYVKPNWMTQDQFEFLTWTANAVAPVQKAVSARRLNMAIPTLETNVIDTLVRNGDIEAVRGDAGRIRGYVITQKGLASLLPSVTVVEPEKAPATPKTLKSFKELKEVLYPVAKFKGSVKFKTPEELIDHLLTSPNIPVPMDACTEEFMDTLRQSMYTNQMSIGYNTALNICKSKNLYTEGRRTLKHNECRAYFFPVNSNMILEKVRRENSNHNDFTLLALPNVPSYEMADLIARFTR